MFKKIVLITALLISAAAAQAAPLNTYSFSYTFTNSTVISGTFDGHVSDYSDIDFIVVNNINVFRNGIPFRGNGDLVAYRYINDPVEGISGFFEGGAVVSKWTSENNFFFADRDQLTSSNSFRSIGSYVFFPWEQTQDFFLAFSSGIDKNGWPQPVRDQDTGSLGDWKVEFLREIPPTPGPVTSPVPEPSTYLLMFAGLGLMGAITRRRQQKSAAA